MIVRTYIHGRKILIDNVYNVRTYTIEIGPQAMYMMYIRTVERY